MLFEAFIDSPVHYLPLIWMLHLQSNKIKINFFMRGQSGQHILIKAPPLEKLLERDLVELITRAISTQHNNTQSSANETYILANLYFSKSLLNSVGCVVTQITWWCGFGGSMDTCSVWVKFSSGLSGLHGSKKLLHGSIFYAGHKFSSVAWVEDNLHVGQKFLDWSVCFFCVCQNFFGRSDFLLHGAKFFAWVNFLFVLVQFFCLGQFFVLWINFYNEFLKFFKSFFAANIDQTLFDLLIFFVQLSVKGGSRTSATFQMESFLRLGKG